MCVLQETICIQQDKLSYCRFMPFSGCSMLFARMFHADVLVMFVLLQVFLDSKLKASKYIKTSIQFKELVFNDVVFVVLASIS